MTQIDLNVSAITDGRSPTRVEFNLQEVVEAFSDIVLSLGTAAITAKVRHEGGWLEVLGANACSCVVGAKLTLRVLRI